MQREETNIPKWLGASAAAVAKKVLEDKTDLPGSIELLTAEQLDKCTTRMNEQRCIIMTGLINKLCPKYGITTKDVLHEFLANVIQESGEFEHKTENMYYRAETIVRTWPSRFKNVAAAAPYAKNPKALANLVYGGRMGNKPGTDDGWNFRGGGFIGLTGRYVYNEFRIYKHFNTVEETAEYVRGSDYGALDSALWFFCVLKDLMDEAERDEFIGIVKEINGGTIGLKDRQYYYELVKKYVV